MIRLLGLLLVAPVICHADEQLIAKYRPLLDQCYEEANRDDAKIQCVGTISRACMGEEEGGETTRGMSTCLHSETVVWDEFLNREYALSMNWAKTADEDDKPIFPEFANRAKSLRDAQRAWIAFRDAECGFEYAIWGAGSMRHISGADCLLQMTADRTVALVNLRETLQ